MAIIHRIEISPDVMMGKPVIQGTRIPVELILRKLGEGASTDDLLEMYPKIEAEDIRAAALYAAGAVAREEPNMDDHLHFLQHLLSEWGSNEDEEAFRNL